jgi:hypothetical protein
MNTNLSQSDELEELLAALVDGALNERQFARFQHLLAECPAAEEYYRRYMRLCAMLEFEHVEAKNDDEVGLHARGNDGSGVLGGELLDQHLPFSLQPSSLPSIVEPPHPTFLFGTIHSMAGYVSSGWPMAYLVATVIFAVGLLLGSLMIVPAPVQVARQSMRLSQPTVELKQEHVGQITGMVDCQWAAESMGAFNGAHVPRGRKYALISGLMEVTYNTGAKVILQGPVTYEVESAVSGFLSVGKLTAKVDKDKRSAIVNQKSEIRNRKLETSNPQSPIPNPLFVVRTPTATVTDLGTEFGVEVDKQGQTSSHVFRGSVELRTVADNKESPTVARVLHENESAVVKRADGVPDGPDHTIALVPTATPAQFVRALPKTTMKTLDLVDVVAGGDGFSGRRNSGIDPTSGRVTDTPPQLDKDFMFLGDGNYHRIDGLPLVDGVFIPNGQSGPVQTDSAGHAFSGFGATANRTGGHIWAGGTIPTSIDHPRAIRTQLGNIDYASAGHGLIFMHANKGITFDLDAIRRANPDFKLRQFRSAAGNTETVSAEGLAVCADVWVLVDGQMRFQRRDISSANGEFTISVPICQRDRFLTLVATDAGNDIGNDWIVFGDPRLELASDSE